MAEIGGKVGPGAGLQRSHFRRITKHGKNSELRKARPYPGQLGKRIFEHVSKEAWKAWLEHQKMLVNENRLNLADAAARKYLAEQMEAHFFGAGADVAAGYVKPGSK